MNREESKKIREAWGLLEWRGSVRIRAVRCGKPNCQSCPHGWYLYFREQKYRTTEEQYIGKCDKNGMPR